MSTLKTCDSVTAYKRYGIAPSYLRFMVNNLFYLPEQYQDCLTRYSITEQNTDDFLAAIRDGMYNIGGIDYQVIYHNTDPTKLLRRQRYTSVKLSFRVAIPLFNILPTVLVKEIKENT